MKKQIISILILSVIAVLLPLIFYSCDKPTAADMCRANLPELQRKKEAQQVEKRIEQETEQGIKAINKNLTDVLIEYHWLKSVNYYANEYSSNVCFATGKKIKEHYEKKGFKVEVYNLEYIHHQGTRYFWQLHIEVTWECK